MHVYLDHPGRAEGEDRPERTLKDLVGVLAEDAVWVQAWVRIPLEKEPYE